jgi:hypothetical protein
MWNGMKVIDPTRICTSPNIFDEFQITLHL